MCRILLHKTIHILVLIIEYYRTERDVAGRIIFSYLSIIWIHDNSKLSTKGKKLCMTLTGQK